MQYIDPEQLLSEMARYSLFKNPIARNLAQLIRNESIIHTLPSKINDLVARVNGKDIVPLYSVKPTLFVAGIPVMIPGVQSLLIYKGESYPFVYWSPTKATTIELVTAPLQDIVQFIGDYSRIAEDKVKLIDLLITDDPQSFGRHTILYTGTRVPMYDRQKVKSIDYDHELNKNEFDLSQFGLRFTQRVDNKAASIQKLIIGYIANQVCNDISSADPLFQYDRIIHDVSWIYKGTNTPIELDAYKSVILESRTIRDIINDFILTTQGANYIEPLFGIIEINSRLCVVKYIDYRIYQYYIDRINKSPETEEYNDRPDE